MNVDPREDPDAAPGELSGVTLALFVLLLAALVVRGLGCVAPTGDDPIGWDGAVVP